MRAVINVNEVSSYTSKNARLKHPETGRVDAPGLQNYELSAQMVLEKGLDASSENAVSKLYIMHHSSS